MSNFIKINIFIFIQIFLINTSVIANDYMSIELQKAVSIECKKEIKNGKYDNYEECSNSLKEALNKIGVVSVSRINDLNIQKKIEKICVFKKKISAVAYNQCIHKHVYKELGLEIIEIPLVISVEKEEEEENITIDNSIAENEDNNLQENKELDSEKEVVEIIPDIPVTEVKEIEFPEDNWQTISQKAIPATYYVLNWIKNPDNKKKLKYLINGSGSAVAIENNLLATACHVVTNFIYNDKDEITGEEFGIINVLHVNDNPRDPSKWIRRLKLHSSDFKTDRCILHHEDLDATPANKRHYNDLKEYEVVYAVGNPQGYYGKIAQGKITRLYNYPPPLTHLVDFAKANIEIIETNAPIDKGNSGGGLFDSNGNLIGIASRCNITGGPRACTDKNGNLTFSPQNPLEQCEFYCNKTQPQNWFIPISQYENLK